MKKQTKGIIFLVAIGSLLFFWGAAASMKGFSPPDLELEMTVTGTPADNFPVELRAQFCGTGVAKSNAYVKEYKIPTDCTQPLAITTDPHGNVWFAETNTGNIAKFDSITGTFTEYENPIWPENARSMMWGMDYSSDGSIWYTDEAFDSIWKFSIQDENYQRLNYPAEGESLPQRLQVEGSQVIVNDFSGNKITFFDAAQSGGEFAYLSLPSPVPDSVTGGFAIDSNDNLWYTNWVFRQDGVLVRFAQGDYFASLSNSEEALPLSDFLQVFKLPPGLNTPNGAAVDSDGKIWLAETSSSYFFRFDPQTESFTKYVTSDPTISTYGNASGLIKTPVTRPYWINLDENGRLVFNEQTANRIAIFDPKTETLTEYVVPSKNPGWADCELEEGEQQIEDCGLAQIFDFTIDGSKIWFTEWVENNIGVIDTSVQLPFMVELDNTQISLGKGETIAITLQVIPITSHDIPIVQITTADTAEFSDIRIETDVNQFQLDSDVPRIIQASITIDENALATSHKILIGAQTDEVTISKYITLTIES